MLLASMGYSDILFYQYIVEKYPDAMIIQDRWNEVPLAYALLGMAPLKIIHFLLATHKNLWQYIPFDFGVMIQRLATKDGASVEFVRDVIRAQRIYFRGLVVDWQQIVAESMIRGHRVPIGMFRVLVEASVSMRSLSMSEEHRVMVNTRVREIEGNEEYANADNDGDMDVEDDVVIHFYEEICDLVTRYALLRHEMLREAAIILCLVMLNQQDDVIKHVLGFL
jgi:hypothetical protein